MPVLLAPRRITAPNPYLAAAHLIEQLPTLIAEARSRLNISRKAQAAQIGISTTTLSRLEGGMELTELTILRCLRWLAINGGN